MTVPDEVKHEALLKWMEASDLIIFTAELDDNEAAEEMGEWWDRSGGYNCSYCFHFGDNDRHCNNCPLFGPEGCSVHWVAINNARFDCAYDGADSDFREVFQTQVPLMLAQIEAT